jgi:hypothetical protein
MVAPVAVLEFILFEMIRIPRIAPWSAFLQQRRLTAFRRTRLWTRASM